MTKQPFESVGPLVDAWRADIEAFLTVLEAHRWGGPGFERLVVVSGETLPDTLRRWMPAERFAQWEAGYAGGRINVTGAIHFTARDGRRTAVVLALPDRDMLLFFAGHEAVEAALSAREDAHGYVDHWNTNLGTAHILWTEYVAERVRREITAELGWPRTELDSQVVSGQLRDLAAELPELLRWATANDAVPQRLYQLWFELARVYAMSLGRADAGDAEEQAEIVRLRTEPLGTETAAAWDAMDSALRKVFDSPDDAPQNHDDDVYESAIQALYYALGAFWNPRFERAVKGDIG